MTAICVAQSVPFLAPLGVCSVMPNPAVCAGGVQGATQFLAVCCPTLRAGGNGVSPQIQQLCNQLAL
jgi:hypothetical protein